MKKSLIFILVIFTAFLFISCGNSRSGSSTAEGNFNKDSEEVKNIVTKERVDSAFSELNEYLYTVFVIHYELNYELPNEEFFHETGYKIFKERLNRLQINGIFLPLSWKNALKKAYKNKEFWTLNIIMQVMIRNPNRLKKRFNDRDYNRCYNIGLKLTFYDEHDIKITVKDFLEKRKLDKF